MAYTYFDTDMGKHINLDNYSSEKFDWIIKIYQSETSKIDKVSILKNFLKDTHNKYIKVQEDKKNDEIDQAQKYYNDLFEIQLKVLYNSLLNLIQVYSPSETQDNLEPPYARHLTLMLHYMFNNQILELTQTARSQIIKSIINRNESTIENAVSLYELISKCELPENHKRRSQLTIGQIESLVEDIKYVKSMFEEQNKSKHLNKIIDLINEHIFSLEKLLEEKNNWPKTNYQ